jgi:adenosylhomocysteine nucleosidase
MRCSALLFVALLLVPSAAAAQAVDPVPRTLVMTAFDPEFAALADALADRQTRSIGMVELVTGTLEGKPVALMKSGVSVVNAAMTTQLMLDHLTVRRIVFSGIAGGVDPTLAIGDVSVPDAWGQYLEASFARATPHGWRPPERFAGAPANWRFVFPRGVTVARSGEPPRRLFTIPADPALVALAQGLASRTALSACVESGARRQCLPHPPRVVVGGTGVTAGIYADNAEFRRYLARAWHARVLDMESASVIQVAYANRVPAIVFRSVSDLAGGDAGANAMTTFMTLASINSARVVRAFIAALPD